MAADVVVIGGTSGLGRALAAAYVLARRARDDQRPRRGAGGAVAAELGGEARGIALDLAEPQAIAGALARRRSASTGSRSSRSTATRTPSATTTSTGRSGSSRSSSSATPRSCTSSRAGWPGRLDPALRRAGEGPAVPGLDDRHDRERRRRDPHPDAGDRARARARQRDPPGDRRPTRPSGAARRRSSRTSAPARRPGATS